MRSIVVSPEDGDPQAAVVLFHGGALRRGTPEELEPHCRALAQHGVLAASAGYRLLGRGADTIDECLSDVRAAIRTFIDIAGESGVEASQVAVGGSSAGAHLALVTAINASSADEIPGSVVAFNPAGFELTTLPFAEQDALAAEIGIPQSEFGRLSLTDLVRPGLPDVLIHHGTADEVEPIGAVRRFRDAMTAAGNRCTLREYDAEHHGFHYPRADGPFEKLVADTARFLTDRVSRC